MNEWIELAKAMPEHGTEVLCFNKNWINEDFNPTGIRIGFLNGEGDFTTAYWWDYQDTYMTINKTECDTPAFSDAIRQNTEPTHWFPIPDNPLVIETKLKP